MIKLLSTNAYCYICSGLASAALIKKVELDIGIGFLELKTQSAQECKNPRKRPGESLAGAHDRDLFWTIPKWFHAMSLSSCFISFAKPLGWTLPSTWSLAYV